MAIPEPFNFNQWIEDNKSVLKPPVSNKELYPGNDDFIVQVVGGPNQRTDFHFEPYPEWFYQIKGNMHVNIMEDGKLRRVDIKEGDSWMLPGNTPHSPQRPEEGSIGLVVERVREAGVTEKVQWYCPNCDQLIRSFEVEVNDIATDLAPVFDQFYNGSDEERTCGNCGAVHPGKA